MFAVGLLVAPAVHAQTAQTVSADFALKPFADFAAGGTFRLLFVTTETTAATSADINTYNTFVQTSANGDHEGGSHSAIQDFSSEFRALISTETVDARDNTATNLVSASDTDAPIYWLGGVKVADGYATFYDGEWDSVAATDQN